MSARIHLPLLGAVAALAAHAASAAAPPDSTLYTTYSVDPTLTSANWVVCGATAENDGCYDFGTLGPFGHIGAMIESQPTVSGQTVTRDIYVLDVASGSSAKQVLLYIYTKKDEVSSSTDTVTVTLKKTISLPLVGGATVTASMAANQSYVYLGTNQSLVAVSVSRSTGAVSTLGAFSEPIPVTEITANSYGYVTITYGAPGGQFSGFYVYGPTGLPQEDGGGGSFMLDASNGVVPLPLPY
jgi:hypothetical protein